MPNPSMFLSDPDGPDVGSGGGSKGWGTLKEEVKPAADPADEDSEPQPGTGSKTGRKGNVKPEGES